MKKTAILIDAGFFIQRINATTRKYFKSNKLSPSNLMKIIWGLVQYHVNGKHGSHDVREPLELY